MREQRPGYGEQYARGEQGEIASASARDDFDRSIHCRSRNTRISDQSRSGDNRPFPVPRCLRMSLDTLFRQN